MLLKNYIVYTILVYTITSIFNKKFIFKMKKIRGVALLVALSVTLILGIFLANNFERSRTNLRLFSNTEKTFSLKTINFSIIKAIALAVRERGANYVYDFVSIIGSIPDFPVNITEEPNINLYNLKMWSMQHYFYLNHEYKTGDEIAILNGILLEDLELADALELDSKKFSLNDKSITEEIKQWFTNKANSGFFSEFTVNRKGGYFDLPSEFDFFLYEVLKKKEVFVNENFNDNLRFRFYATDGKKNTPVSKDDSGQKDKCLLSALNVNMIPKNNRREANQILDSYLGWFRFHSSKYCKEVASQKDNLQEIIEKNFFGDDEEELLLLTNIGNTDFTSNLNGIPDKYKKHFTYRSNLAGMKYTLEQNEVKINITLYFYLEYKSDNNTVIPDAVHIIYYKVS